MNESGEKEIVATNKNQTEIREKEFQTEIIFVPVRPNRKSYVEELKINEVRWFYSCQLDDTKWLPLIGRDSLLLEIKWRQKNNIDIDSKIAEQAAKLCCLPNIAVLNGLYALSESGIEITPIYWNDSPMVLRRGTWFLSDYQPLNPNLADLIEEHHLKTFKNQLIPDGPFLLDKDAIKRPTLADLKSENYEIRWNSIIDVTLYSTSTKSRFLRYISLEKGAVLSRGYKEDAEFDDSPKPIGHLIFVVHGVGQKGYEGLIAKNTEGVRNMADLMFDKQYDKEPKRPMFLPVEWRSSLTLDDGLTDVITVRHMESMRNALNSTAMDIMYYQSPMYRDEIVGSLVRVLNQLYQVFLEHNPDFGGTVSLLAHSLGSVMAYDVLTDWSPFIYYDHLISHMLNRQSIGAQGGKRDALLQFQDTRQKMSDLEGGIEKLLHSPEHKLNFRVVNLFCIGSPLAVFLAMRGQHGANVVPQMEQVHRVFNIFHPSDPVAYRYEPLVHKKYRHIRPVKIHSFQKARLKTSYAVMPMEMHKRSLRKLSEISREHHGEDDRAIYGDVETNVDILLTTDKNDGLDDDDDDANDKDDEEEYEGSECESSTDSPIRPDGGDSSSVPKTPPVKRAWWKFGKEGRGAVEFGTDVADENAVIASLTVSDYKNLPPVERLLANITKELKLPYRLDYSLQQGMADVSYWSVLKSHSAYWTNQDLVMFILMQLYDEI